MAVAALSRFTVPLRTDQSRSTQGLLMPKLKYRFRITFENFGIAGSDTVELTKQVVSFNRPQVTFEDLELPVYNSRVKLAGKPNWADTSVVLRDDAGGNVSRLVGYQLQKQFDFMEQSSAAAGGDYKFNMRCEMLDGGNGDNTVQILETWELVGAFIKEANYQDLSYASNEASTITLAIRFDNATQSPGGTGVGTMVGRAIGGLNVTL
jgi:hypothetical protein